MVTDDYEKEIMLMDELVGVASLLTHVITQGEILSTYQIKDLTFSIDHVVSAYTNLHGCVYRGSEEE